MLIKGSGRKKRHIMLLAVAAVILLYIGISLWISVNWITVREYEVNLELTGEDILAVVVADLHDHEFGPENVRLIEKIREQRPDLIFMDGDMLNASSENAETPLNLVRALAEVAPVYYALGNHELEYMDNGHSSLVEELEDAGAVVLEKTYVDIDVRSSRLRIGGMYEYAFGLNGNNDALAAPSDTLNYLQNFQQTDRTKLMLAHRPDSFIFGDAASTWKIDLVISGHNHGGQVVLPFLGGLYGGDQGWFPEYVHGLYQKGNLQMFVTSGLGSHKQKLPRFNNPPEIAVLKIK